MDIQTRSRRRPVKNRLMGRARLALVERKEAPVAAIVSIIALALATLTRSASAGREADGDTDAPQALRSAEADPLPMCLAADAEPLSPLDFSVADLDETGDSGMRAHSEDLGRIGLGPGPLDLSRFFGMAAPVLALPDAPSYGTAGLRSAKLGSQELPNVPLGAGAADGPGAPGGSAGGNRADGPVGGDGGSGAGGGHGAGGAGENGTEGNGGPETVSHVHFEDLFAMLVAIADRFQPATVRDISTAAIGDWISQHELYRLQGLDGPQAPDAAFHQREERTYQLLAEPASRDAFIREHFPSVDFTDPGTCRPVGDHYHAPTPEDGLDTETYTTLL